MYLDNEEVQDRLFHAANVEVKNLKREFLQDGYDPHQLALNSPRDNSQYNVRA